MNEHKFFMKEAIKEAEKAVEKGNWGIGCVIELNGKIISKGHSTGDSEKNKLGHAEINAMQKASEILYDNPGEATIYTTYEPCPMCFGAIILSKIKKVVYGASCEKTGAMHFHSHLPPLFKEKEFNLEIIKGVLEENCQEVFDKGKKFK